LDERPGSEKLLRTEWSSSGDIDFDEQKVRGPIRNEWVLIGKDLWRNFLIQVQCSLIVRNFSTFTVMLEFSTLDFKEFGYLRYSARNSSDFLLHRLIWVPVIVCASVSISPILAFQSPKSPEVSTIRQYLGP
jgi:hypothetical protein